MDAVTLIVDAPALINWIHGLKQWIYDGSVRIVVPLSTLDEVERQYKASVAAKETPKEPVAKRATGRASKREEQPLFDINPRTTWEFLSRIRDKNDPRVEFQQEGEEFSQWKVEDQSLPSPERQHEPPSSFADALLRKLNITNGSEPPSTEGDSKPKLISMNSDSDSTRTQQKVPKLASKSVPPNLLPFFSYTLWKIYEAGNDPSKPIKYEILAEESRTKDVAEMLGIGVCDGAELMRRLLDRVRGGNERSTYGELEREFPSHKNKPTMSHQSEDAEIITASGHHDEEMSHQLTANDPITQSHHELASARTKDNMATSLAPEAPLTQQKLEQKNGSTIEPRAKPASTPTAPSNHIETSSPSHNASTEEQAAPVNLVGASITQPQDDSELDSDEEIIVFNPRAKRGSWRPRTPAGASEPSHSRPNTSNGHKQEDFGSSTPAKSPIKSTLKPQSPVFTPGQLYSPVGTLTENGQGVNTLVSTNGSSQQPVKSPARSPILSHSKLDFTKSATGQAKSRQAPTNEDRRQQSEIIIQRQREAITRQANATQKPPPRRVQKEPTDNPTIIDPDAFDRSYVVQPPTHSTDRGGKRRSGPKHKPGPKGNAQQAGGAKPESEDDFVLKSGAPRGSMRGKGKLFVP